MNNVMSNKLIDLSFCVVLVGLLSVSIYWIVINEQTIFLGLPFIIIYFVFIVLAKTQFGPLGKRLAKKRIGSELLVIGAILTTLALSMQYFF